MTTGNCNKYWVVTSILLIVIAIVAGIIAWSRYQPSQPIEVTLAPEPEVAGEISISGSINNPGCYPFTADDSIADIILAAGGTTDGADFSRITFTIPQDSEQTTPQKVNLNRADVWLLEALPGIGETRALAIIEYREKNGRFHHSTDLLKVEGIGSVTYEKIKHLITVTD